jgi:hypothetical protein|nr:MAG TPA_asm: minor tail protein [Caudoviricetes sp.]
MADGSVIIGAEIDDKQAQTELNRLSKKIDALNNKIADKKQEKMPLVEQTKQLAANLDAAKAKLDQMQSGKEFFTAESVKEQERTVKSLQKEYDAADKSLQNMDKAIQNDTTALNRMKDEAGGYAERLAQAKNETRGISPAAEAASKHMEQFTNRIKVLARRVLVFSLITKALRSLKDYMWSAIQTNEDAMASIAKLKAALMTLAQPIVNVVIPAFTVLVDVITRVVNAISRLLSMLFGTTAEESAKAAENLYEQQKALKGVGSAAKKAKGSLASFDEINKLSSDSSGSGGGSSSGVVPDFKNMVSSSLSALLELFTGAALLSLGAILAFSGANVPLGLSLMALGALAIWDAVSTNWDVIKNLLRGAIGDAVAITSTVLLVFGALLAFSGANIPVGIGMILAGAIGLAAVTAANWDTMRDTLAESIGKVLTVIGASLLVIGAILAFSGVKVALGIGMMVAGAAVLAVGSAALNWDAITSNVQTAIGKIFQIVGASLLVLGLLFVLTGVKIPLGLGLMAAGGAALGVGEAILNWNAIKEKFAEVWSGIKQWWNSNCAEYFKKEYWASFGRDFMDGFLDGLKSAFETVKKWVTSAVNWIKSQFSGAKAEVSNAGSSFSSASGGARQSASFPISVNTIPALARGAVIPPNREFLAVLGDQRSGNNYEVPDAKLRQLLREELSALGGKNEAVLMLDRDVLGRVVYQLNKAEGNRIGVSLTGV